MKIAALSLLALASSAAAFVPSQTSMRAAPMRMSEEAAEEAEAEAEPEVPLLQVKETVPCFGAAPLLGGEVFVGENYWNKLTTEIGSEDTGTFLRAAELKHGRSAMIATLGFAAQKFGITFDKISPHEYLSETQGIKFADLNAMSPVDAFNAIPAEGLAQIFAAIALVEIYELTHRDGEIKTGERVAPGWQSGGLTGDLGWNPLGIKVTDRRRLVEIQNGRAAMFAICAWVCHDTVPGSVPIPLLWD